MTFITVDILSASIGIIFSFMLGMIVTYVSILKASSNFSRKLIIKTIMFAWMGVVLLLAIPLWFSYMHVLPEWIYWAGVTAFLLIFIPLINNYYKNRAKSL